MYKHFTPPIFRTLKALAYVAFGILLIITACKKNYSEDVGLTSEQNNKLAEWYKANLKISDENPFSKLVPNWEKVYIGKKDNKIVYEVELTNPENLIVLGQKANRSNLEQEVKKHTIKLLLFEDEKTKKILYASYMSLEKYSEGEFEKLHYKNLGNFTGTVLYYHFTGQLANGWNYTNGRIAEKITVITEKQFDQLQTQTQGDIRTEATVCQSGFADKYQWTCVGVPGYENCGFTYVGKEYVTYCSYEEEDKDYLGNEDESGGGYFPPEYTDCAGVAGGTAIWSNECNTCIGGTTGLTACPKEIRIDTNARKCLDTLSKGIISSASVLSAFQKIFTIGTNSNNVADMIGRISQSSDWNVEIREGNINNQTNYNGDTIETNAQTTATQGMVFITFNKPYLNQATNLSVARTMIHELMHAYFVYGMAMTLDPGYSKFIEANDLLFKKNGNPIYDQNDAQHEQIANKYVDQMSLLLEAYAISAGIQSPNPNISLFDYCKDLAWGGLSDTKAYRKYANNKTRIQNHLKSEAKRDVNSTKKKGC